MKCFNSSSRVHCKFGSETTVVLKLSFGHKQLLVITLYLLMYECYNAFVLIKFYFSFLVKINKPEVGIIMSWDAFKGL